MQTTIAASLNHLSKNCACGCVIKRTASNNRCYYANIAASPNSWNYSVMGGCRWAIMTTDGNNTADNACRLQ